VTRVDQNLIVRNPADRAKPPSAKEARPPEIYPWSAEELATFLRWADQQGCLDAVDWRALAFTGMRRGEALALRWRDLDVEASRVSVRRSVGLIRTKGEGAQLVEGPTKSGRERVIDLDPQTLAASRGWRVARAGLDLRLARDDALIFSALDGGHQHPERLSRRFKEGLARCGRQFGDAAPPMIRLHDLRHTHTRDSDAQGWGAGQGGFREARAFRSDDHDDDLSARDARNAGLGSRQVRGTRGRSVMSQKRSEERRVGKECRSRWSPYH